MNHPLALTDAQMLEVRRAARTLLPSQRERFLEGLARRLTAEPTDEAVIAALKAQLDRLTIFSCDSKGANK